MIDRLRALAGWLGARLSQLSGEEVRVSRGLVLDAHPLATVVTLTLDRPRRLRFTMAEAVRLKKTTGISVWTGEGTPDGQGLDIGALDETVLLELLTICASADDPSVTADALAPHVAGETLMDVVAALMVLVGDFLPEVPEDLVENPLMASALLRLMSSSTGRSPQARSGSGNGITGGSHLA